MYVLIKLFVAGVIPCWIPSITAQTVYKLDGKIGGKCPIMIELEEFDDGLFSGWYAYKSTLQRSRDNVCSWLLINPSHENPATQWDIRDCKLNLVETWSDVRFDGQRLSAQMKNTRGKSYDVVATITQQAHMGASLMPYYKQHIAKWSATSICSTICS